MISLESEVLQRHLPLFSGKSILLAGGINDDFPQILQKHCQSVQVWSWYFDYAKTQSAVNFEVEFQPQADLIIYYWTKNKQEVNFQLMQLLAKSKIGQEVLIIGENRCGVRSAEKLLEPYGQIGKSILLVVAVYTIFPYKNNRTLIFNLIGNATKMMH